MRGKLSEYNSNVCIVRELRAGDARRAGGTARSWNVLDLGFELNEAVELG